MLKRIIAFFLCASLLCAQSINPGDLIYSIKNTGTGSTAVGLTPSTSTDILAFNGSGRLTRVARSAFAVSGGTGTLDLSSYTLTLGTITNGTWQGTVIAPAYLGVGSSIATKFLRGDGTWQTIPGGGDALTSNPLSQFATTTSEQLRSVLSDESGTGVFLTTNGSAAGLTSFPTLNQNTTGSAATLTTPRTINGVAFDGSANITVTAAAGTLTGNTLNSSVTASALTSVGTITSGTWQGSVIAPTYLGTGSSISTKFLRGDGTWQTLSGTGTVTSVALALPSIFSVSGSPVTDSGTLTGTLAVQTANTIFAGPTTGSAEAPTFRSLVVADIPNLSGVYEPLIGTGTLALSKLAADPLARANHTGTQLLASISDAGTLAGLNTVASAQIANGTIVDEDINASAAIAPTKLAASPNVVSLLGATDYAAIRTQLGLGTLATQNATITDYLLAATASTTYQPVAGVLSLAGFSSITGTLADGNIASATTWNAKQSALTFSTGLTNTTGTVTVNTSQSISTLSNLTGNGFVKTSGGTGTLSVDTTAYEPLIGTGTLALTKLATDPLARANHTGTQLLSTISDAGTIAALNAIASANITDGTIVNADISPSAAIALSKLATDPLARANHTGTQAWSTITSVPTILTTFGNLSSAAGVLTNNGAGTLSYTATSQGGAYTADSAKLAVYSAQGVLASTDYFSSVSIDLLTTARYGSNNIVWYDLSDGVNAWTHTLSLTPATDNYTHTLPAATGVLINTGNLSDITAVGTISTGTWQGSVIAPAYLGTGSSIGTKYLRGDGTWQTIAGGGDALTTNPLSQFAATTSAQLRGVLTDESGTGEFLTTNGSAASLTSFPTLNQNTTGTAAGLSTTLAISSGGTGSTTASDARTALGLAIGTNVQAYSANLTTYAGIAPSSNIQSLLGAADYAAVKTLLTLNNVENTTLSTWAGTSNVTTLGTITAGTWSATAIAVLNGGTGATTAADARTNLGLVIGTHVQAYSANLTTFAGIAPSANVQSLLGAADYSAIRTLLSLGTAALVDTGTSSGNVPVIADFTLQGPTIGRFERSTHATQSAVIYYGGLYWEDVDASGFRHDVALAAPSANRIHTLPNASGTIITTGNLSAITATGTISAGTWQGSIIAPAYLGTGSSISTKFLRGDGTWQSISGGGDALTTSPLSQFAATTSAQLRGVLTDENGTGEFLTTNGSAASLTSFPTLNQNTTGSAATLTTPRTINGVSFDGSANITVTAAAGTLTGSTLASGVTASSLTSVGTLASGAIPTTLLTGTITSAQITDETLVNADINASAAIAGTKVDAATTTTRGTVELATDGETSASVAVQGSDNRLVDAERVELVFVLTDDTTAITAGTGKKSRRVPFAFTLTGVRAQCLTAPTGSTIIIDINETGSTVLGTKLSIDASETTSTTAASSATITDSTISDDAVISFDFDQVGSTIAGAGITVTLYGTR